MKRTVAIFGGSFNPPHIAHVLAATFVLTMEEAVESLMIVPCFLHPFAKSLAPFEDRLAMCEHAFGWLPRVEISTVERDLGGESRTIRTVRYIGQQHPDWALRLVVGTDIMADAHRWDRFDEVQRIAPPIVLARPGWTDHRASAGVFPEVSSSEVREALRTGKEGWASGWLPPSVLRYALSRSLYSEGG